MAVFGYTGGPPLASEQLQDAEECVMNDADIASMGAKLGGSSAGYEDEDEEQGVGSGGPAQCAQQ